MFNLKDFDHLRDDNTVQFKEEIVDGVEVIVICYMISNDELWEKPLGRETRGHAFRKDTGELISLAFGKFFNLGEKDETQPHNVNWKDEFEVASKADGSMLSFALINDKVFAKTKKSFHSNMSTLANKLMPDNVKNFVKFSLENHISPIFEFTHPEWKIVIDYGNEPTWKLLAMRDMDSGHYYDKHFIKQQEKSFNIEAIEYHDFKSYEEIKNSVDNLTNAEGYVIHFPATGFRMKTKCKWYQNLHRINTTLRVRDITKMAVDETLDDIKSEVLNSGKNINKILEIENLVLSDYNMVLNEIDSLIDKYKNYTSRKDFAMAHSRDKYFGEAIKVLDSKDFDWKFIWNRDFMKNYKLTTVYSNFIE